MSLPPGWIKLESKSHPGREYYYNQSTGESTWEMPTAASQAAQVHAAHLLVKHAGSRRPSSWKEVLYYY